MYYYNITWFFDNALSTENSSFLNVFDSNDIYCGKEEKDEGRKYSFSLI